MCVIILVSQICKTQSPPKDNHFSELIFRISKLFANYLSRNKIFMTIT